MKVVYVYTDGSACANGKNKGKGGFGTYFPDLGGEKKAYSMGFRDTKTGRMETMALYYAVKAMPLTSKDRVILRVFSDSKFVVDTFAEKWIDGWIRRDFVNVKNDDVWRAILKELNKRRYLMLRTNHICSHQVEKAKTQEQKDKLMKNPHIIGNMIADRLADYKRHKILRESDSII